MARSSWSQPLSSLQFSQVNTGIRSQSDDGNKRQQPRHFFRSSKEQSRRPEYVDAEKLSVLLTSATRLGTLLSSGSPWRSHRSIGC